MITDNRNMSEEDQNSYRNRYSKGDKEEYEELSKILAGDGDMKDQLLIQYVHKVKNNADLGLKESTKLLIDSMKNLDEKHRSDQLEQLMSKIDQIDN